MKLKIIRTHDVSSTLQLRYLEVAPEIVVRGVFARVDIPNETLVEECPVIPIYANERTPRINAIRSYEYEWKVKDEHGTLIVSHALAAGMGGMYNHGSPSNLGNVNHLTEFRIEFWSLRDIEAGEELTIDYMWRGYAGTRLNPVDKYLRPIPTVTLRRLGRA